LFGGLDIIKITKTQLIYSVSRFNLGGLGALFGRSQPTKDPRGDGTAKYPQSVGSSSFWKLIICTTFFAQY